MFRKSLAEDNKILLSGKVGAGNCAIFVDPQGQQKFCESDFAALF